MSNGFELDPDAPLEDATNLIPENRYSVKDFELDAFSILDSASDYNTAINDLASAYKDKAFDDTAVAKDILSTYGEDIRHKFKEPALDFASTLASIPVTLSEMEGSTIVDKINKYEEDAISFLDNTNDPDYLVSRKALESQIKNFASEARRDEYQGEGESIWNTITDLSVRGVRGVVGPVSKAVGLDEVDKYLYEHTDREADDSLLGMIAYGAGAFVPVGISTLLPGAAGVIAPAVIAGTQAVGEAKEIYRQGIEATGDEAKAALGAALVGGSQILPVLPLQRAASGLSAVLGSFIFKKATAEAVDSSLAKVLLETLESKKASLIDVGWHSLEGSGAGAIGVAMANAGMNISLNENRDITSGVATGFLANGIIAGGLSGFRAVLNNALINQTQRLVKEYQTKETKPDSETARSEKTKAKVRETTYRTDEKGRLVEEDPLDPSSEDIQEGVKSFEEDINSYINEDVDEVSDVYYSEVGEPFLVQRELDTEFEVPDVDFKSIPILTGDIPSEINVNPFIVAISKKLLGNNQLVRNILDGAFASFSVKEGQAYIKLLRSLGSSPDQLSRTLAHEFTHFLDYVLLNENIQSPSLKAHVSQLQGIAHLIPNAMDSSSLKKQSSEISQKWRPGWDGSLGSSTSAKPGERFNAYRASYQEIFADVGSAILGAPEWVRTNYPEVYTAFEKTLAKSPKLNQFWSEFLNLKDDPGAIYNFRSQTRREARERHADLAVALEKKEGIGTRLKNSIDETRQQIFNAILPAKRALNKLSNEARVVGSKLYNDIGRKGFLYPWLKRNIDEPLNKWLLKSLQSGIELNDIAQYMYATNIKVGTTPTMERIRSNPSLYAEAAKTIHSFLSREKGVKPSILDAVFDAQNWKSPEDIMDALAQIPLIGDTAQILNMYDFLAKYPPNTPNRVKLAMRDYTLAKNSLAKRKQNIPVENLIKYIDKLSTDPKSKNSVSKDLKDALKSIVRPNAFSARRYLINEGAYTKYDADADTAHLRNKLGEDKYLELEELSGDFHNIVNSGLDLVREAQIFTPEVMERIELNKGNYVTHLILDHFKGDENIDGSVRTAIGSLSEIGNELTATPLKMKAVYSRAYFQKAVNSAVDLAVLSGEAVTEVKVSNQADIFKTRDQLSKDNPNDSYLVRYTDGVPAISKIQGSKLWEKMFETYGTSEWALVNTLLGASEAFNKTILTKGLKTVFSPGYILRQKYYDRKLEAMLANSFEISLGIPVHTSKTLRSIDKQTISELKHYHKTGELTGNLKEAVDLDAVALNLSKILIDNGEDLPQSFEHSVYESFGKELPGKTILDKISDFNNKAVEKVGGNFLKHIAEFDETRTKVNGFAIGKKIWGMSDAEAAVFARENFGVPDPLGGGTKAPLINKAFLFGRAHLNGLRVLGRFLNENKKVAIPQLMYRMVLPKLLLAPALMYPVMQALGGNDLADKYDVFLKMVPTFRKISSSSIIPLGFQDGQGNFHSLFDPTIRLSNIQSDWKAWYIREPQARELTTISKVLWPFITNLGKGQFGTAFTSATEGAFSQSMAGVQPIFQYLSNLGAIAIGKNPQDFFRDKDILKKRVAEAGTLGEKVADYGEYFFSQQVSPLVPYNPFRTEDPRSTGEKALLTPIVGPLGRALVEASNYGLVEDSKEAKGVRQRINAEIANSTGEKTQDLLDQYSLAMGQVSSLGKGWEKQVGPTVSSKIHQLITWHSREWVRTRDLLRLAQEKGDAELYDKYIRLLEKRSITVHKHIGDLRSSVENRKKK